MLAPGAAHSGRATRRRTHSPPRNETACEKKTGTKNTRWCEALPPKKAPKTQSAQLSGAESLTTPALFIVHAVPPIFLFFLRRPLDVRQFFSHAKTSPRSQIYRSHWRGAAWRISSASAAERTHLHRNRK